MARRDEAMRSFGLVVATVGLLVFIVSVTFNLSTMRSRLDRVEAEIGTIEAVLDGRKAAATDDIKGADGPCMVAPGGGHYCYSATKPGVMVFYDRHGHTRGCPVDCARSPFEGAQP